MCLSIFVNIVLVNYPLPVAIPHSFVARRSPPMTLLPTSVLSRFNTERNRLHLQH